MSKEKLIPKLRFPEFKDVWNPEQLSNLLDYERPDNYIVKDTNYVTSGTPVLTANKSFILGYTQETFGICNDIPAIIFDDFTIDKKFVDFPFKVKSSAIKILRPKSKDDLKFLFELMSLIRFEAKEHKRYYISAYQNLSVPIPKPTEQQKIAATLSSLDDLITAQNEKIKALQAHKKSLMQQLFPAEGERVPRLRFPEFQEMGDWEKKLLKDLAKVSTLKNKDKKLNRVLTNSAIDGIVDQREFFEKDIANKNNLEGYYVVDFGDYVYNPRVSLLAPVGPISKNKVGIGIMSPLYTVFRFFNMENDFFEHYFKTVHWHGHMRSIANDGARHDRMAIKIEEFIELPLPYPSLNEQQKIAATLSSLDDLLKTQNQKLEALKKHKKGLMQQLFPNPNDLA
jgi:type I restriction enzyme S subunit